MAVTKNISLDYQDVIVIGRRGENEAVDIVWDISPLVAEFGGGTALVLAKRATDESAYPVTLTEQTENTLTWTVSSVDSCVIGVGKVQLFWYVGNVLAKSFMWRTFTGDDITGMVGDPPEPYESWLEHLAEMGADILNDAKDEVKNAEAWAVGERGGEPVVDGDETYHNNAKYWSGVSSDYAGNAESSADAAEQSAGDAAHQVELAEAQVTLAEGQVALAEQKVQDAAAQVTLAEAQAQAAAGKANEASGYATAASNSASDANTFSGQAYTSAQNAAQSASDAAGYASDALGYKNAASDSATIAGNKATEASGYADNASTYANNASGYADAASDSADAAAASATEAAGYVATLVNGKAGVLEDSATGDVVSIVPDKSVGHLYKAEVSLSPIQSLNGYDHPWAGGAGANKYDLSLWNYTTSRRFWGTNTSTVVSVLNSLPEGTYTITAKIKIEALTSGDTSARTYGFYTDGRVVDGTIAQAAPSVGTVINVAKSFTISAAQVGTFTACYWYSSSASATGDLATIYDVGVIEGSVSGYIPYENLCPISGHTGATLNVTGANLFDPSMLMSFTESGGVYSGSSTYINGVVFVGFDGDVGRITLSLDYKGDTSSRSGYFKFVYTDGTIDYAINCASNVWRTMSATSANGKTVKRVEFGSSNVVNMQLRSIMLNFGTTALPYEPYVGSRHTSSFGQTVYGGTFDFVSGKLVVTHKAVTFDGTQTVGLANWETSAGDGTSAWLYRRSLFPDIKVPTDPTVNIICDRLRPLPYGVGYGGVYGRANSGVCTVPASGDNWSFAMRIPVDGITTATQINAWLANNPVTVVYELATPIEIDLDPTEVQTLQGLNNVWASDGEMSVDYAADIKTYIDNKIAAAVAALS